MSEEKILEEQRANYDSVADEFKKFSEDIKNPVVVGALLTKLQEERARSNLLFKQLNEKMDRIMQLENRLNDLEDVMREVLTSKVKENTQKTQLIEKEMLTEVQEKIIELIKAEHHVDAEKVQATLKYKGKNAASQQLTELVQKGLLERKQVGRKAFFSLR